MTASEPAGGEPQDDVLELTEVLVPGLTYTAGTELDVRLRVAGTGTTELAATVCGSGRTAATVLAARLAKPAVSAPSAAAVSGVAAKTTGVLATSSPTTSSDAVAPERSA